MATRALLLAVVTALAAACAELAPLREPPLIESADPAGALRTRDEAIARLGPPHQVRASDVGEVLVYRRVVVVDANPSRWYGQDRGARLDRYELLLLHLGPDGRIVRWAVEPE